MPPAPTVVGVRLCCGDYDNNDERTGRNLNVSIYHHRVYYNDVIRNMLSVVVFMTTETLCENCGSVLSVTECPYCGKRVKDELNTAIYFGVGCILGFTLGMVIYFVMI